MAFDGESPRIDGIRRSHQSCKMAVANQRPLLSVKVTVVGMVACWGRVWGYWRQDQGRTPEFKLQHLLSRRGWDWFS